MMHAHTPAVGPFATDPHFVEDPEGLLSWLFSVDQRRIALMQLFGLAVSSLIGALVGLVMQLERVTPRSDLLSPEAFAASFTMHGGVMIFLLLVPAIPGTLGALVLPKLLGARNVAFPRLHLVSLQLWTLGAVLLVMAVALGGATTGWTLSVPLSLEAGLADAFLAVGMALVAFSAVLRAIVVMTSIHMLRKPGLTWSRLSPFAWSLYGHSVVTLIAGPVVVITILLLLAERSVGLGLFDPATGGDPLLFQNFFWFGAHGFAYAAILPAVGIISQVFLSLGNPQKQAPRSLLVGLAGLGIVGLLSWGVQTPTSGHGTISLTFFSLITLLSMVPAAQVLGSWLLSLSQGVENEAPIWFALGGLVLFVVGGLATLPLGALSTAVYLHGTTFAVGQSHLLFGSVAVAFLAGLHLWWADFGIGHYSDSLAKTGALLTISGMLVAFMPLLLLGGKGLPRRLASYPAAMQPLHIVSAAGGVALAAGITIVAISLLLPLLRGGELSQPTSR